MRTISWISPFAYYDALSILAGDGTPLRDIAILLSVATVFVVIAYVRFDRRDL
jgi:hypothetical protein